LPVAEQGHAATVSELKLFGQSKSIRLDGQGVRILIYSLHPTGEFQVLLHDAVRNQHAIDTLVNHSDFLAWMQSSRRGIRAIQINASARGAQVKGFAKQQGSSDLKGMLVEIRRRDGAGESFFRAGIG
jgi:hypothetical protein